MKMQTIGSSLGTPMTLSAEQEACSQLCDVLIKRPTGGAPVLPGAKLDSSLNFLPLLIESFRKAIEKADINLVLSPKEVNIVQCARNEWYQAEELIESCFWKYGGDQGIVSLILVYRIGGATLRQWSALHEYFHPWLVGQTVEMINKHLGPRLPLLLSQQCATCVVPRLTYLGKNISRRRPQLPSSPVSVDDHHEPRTACSEPPFSLFDDLDQHHRELFLLVVCLGGKKLPITMLHRATKTREIFGCAGEITQEPPPNLGPLFRDAVTIDCALKKLASRGMVRIDGHDEISYVSTQVEGYLESATQSNKAMYSALKLMLHSFPIDVELESGLFGEVGRSQFMHLRHVMKFLDYGNLLGRLSCQESQQILRSCLSWSQFGDVDWKREVLNRMKEFENRIGDSAEAELLLCKSRQRRRALSRLYPDDFEFSNCVFHIWPIKNESSNAYYGEVLQFQAQLLVDQDRLHEALCLLRGFMPLNQASPSLEERNVLPSITFLRQKIYHFAGDFQTAQRSSEELFHGIITKQIRLYYYLDTAAILSELDQFDQANTLLGVRDFVCTAWQQLGKNTRIISLAAAGVFLSKGLWTLKNSGFQASLFHLNQAKRLYECILAAYREYSNANIIVIVRLFSSLSSLAIIAHLECRFEHTDWEYVLSCWESASDAVGKLEELFGHDQSFLRMIILYSKSNILLQLGLVEDARKLVVQSKILYQRTGRSFYFLALGSKWFDLVGDWNKEDGIDRISDLSFHEYCKIQEETGYPQKRDGRLCV